tara:strand:- start:8739 stop:9416 length:678 start_codon:yes stop_codon:yes gene_type:complete
MDQAQFIFRGTVEQVQAANLPEIKDVSNTIVVKVDEVVYAPPGFTDWTGKLITVAAKKPTEFKPQSQRLFYTNGWLYGQSLAVVEVGDGNFKDRSNEEVLMGVQHHQDNDVQERLKRADLVVVGQIIAIKKDIEVQRISEHNPLWATVTVKVDNYLKGSGDAENVQFSHPTSRDVMWADAPRFDEGVKGIWILHQSELVKGKLTITEKRDFFPIERLTYIESLLK